MCIDCADRNMEGTQRPPQLSSSSDSSVENREEVRVTPTALYKASGNYPYTGRFTHPRLCDSPMEAGKSADKCSPSASLASFSTCIHLKWNRTETQVTTQFHHSSLSDSPHSAWKRGYPSGSSNKYWGGWLLRNINSVSQLSCLVFCLSDKPGL